MKKLMIVFLGVLLFVAFSSAQTDCTFEYSSTTQLLSSFEQINSKLSTCNVAIPEDLSFALKNKNILVSIIMDSSEIEEFYISIGNDRILSITPGAPEKYSYSLASTEDALDAVLQSENMVDTFFIYLDKGNIAVDPQGFMATMTWFFANLFF